jgi:SAM-dependent methyltransferase
MDWQRFWNDSALVRESDFRRQVGRTLHQVPYSDEDIDRLVHSLRDLLQPPAAGASLLDLACGNGLITSRLAPYFASVTGVDFSTALVATANEHFRPGNVHYVVGDALDVRTGSYDRVLMSGAWQYFDAQQATRLLQQLSHVVPANGRLVLGDVADRDRLWNFYRGLRGRWRYLSDLARDTPIIGHWWRPSALRAVAEPLGWDVVIHYQTPDSPNHFFRYDAVLRLTAQSRERSR